MAYPAGSQVEILLPRPFDRGFDYLVPPGMTLAPGQYVRVPFGREQLVGVVWGEGTSGRDAAACKPVAACYDHLPPVTATLRQFVDWTAHYYLHPKGAVLKMLLLPPAITHSPKIAAAEQAFRFNPPLLTQQQSDAAGALRARIDRGFSVSVLDGLTGSGKTEVYFEAIEAVLRSDQGQVLVLLPEIALTAQWIARCEARFGTEPILWHSDLTPARRRDNWLRIAQGTARLIVGARSALYLPYPALKLIVVDEEHETSYKQEDHVPYHARDMAVARAHREHIPAVLVSATPSLETMHNIARGKYSALTLSERHGRHGAAPVELIDLRRDKPERGSWLSPPLRAALAQTLERRAQALLFLNRRGYAPLVLCRHCGHRFHCAQCSAWLVRHQHPARLECHHCGHREPLPPACPACGEKDQLVACGPGVERVQEEVMGLFPQARLALLTSDEKAVAEQVARIIGGEVDIVIGTQLAAKGHHFPQLALAAIIDADLGLSGGDLRACEHTFQLLMQVAGRAGRAEVAGRVLLQTTQPQHPVLEAMAAGDRDGFLAAEMAAREQAGWPPFGRLAALLLDGKKEQDVAMAARSLRHSAPDEPGLRVLGPAPAPLSKRKGQFRYRLLVKATRQVPLQDYLIRWLTHTPLPASVRLKVDVDPYSFL